MAQYNNLKTAIAAVIKQNGNNEITGDLLQQTLIAIVNGVGLGYQFMGVATPTTAPGTPDARIFYIASQEGQYPNFGGVTLDGNQFALFLFAADWSSIVLDLPTKTYVDASFVAKSALESETGDSTETTMTQKAITDALNKKVDKVPGKGLSTNDLTDALQALIEGAFQKSDIVSELGDDETKVLSQAAITIILESYAKTNGNYPEMTVGAAENLVGRGSVLEEINFRTAGGTADIGSGTAIIKKILGKTLAWNQLVKNGNFADQRNYWEQYNADASVSDGIITIIPNNASGQVCQTIKTTIGHKYYVALSFNSQGEISIAFDASIVFNDTKNGWFRFSQIRTATNAQSNFALICSGIQAARGKNFIAFDLTLMFGDGNEPSTVEEFEAMFPLPYYAYNPGQLVSNRAMKLKTVGFNQWDEQWEVGTIAGGEPVSDPDCIRSKNFIPVFPSTTYYSHVGSMQHPSSLGISFYDSNFNYLSYEYYTNTTFVTPYNAYYIKIWTQSNPVARYGNVYLHDICINLSWSGVRNGEYEPYWESEIDLNLLTRTGKKDGVGESVVVFPDGLRSAGSVQSEIEADGVTAHKRIGAVDMGTLDWTYAGDDQYGGYFYAYTNPVSNNSICSVYENNPNFFSSPYKDKCFINYVNFNTTCVRDGSFNGDAAAFKAAMSGVMLYYELAEPETYILDEPVPMNYRVDDFGTEAKEPADTEQENGVYAPLTLMVQYAMNAVDTLRRLPVNYISKPSFDAFCAELSAKLGAAINKNISIVATYDTQQEKYNYTITITDIEQP